jgi:hypothetical protein
MSVKISTLVIFLVLFANPAMGQRLNYSTDVGTSLDGNVVFQGDVVSDPQPGNLSVSDPLMLSRGTDLAGLAIGAGGSLLFSVDATSLLGGVLVTRSDIGRLTGAVFSLAFDGSANGIPAGARIDAFTLDGTDLLLSFDIGINFGGFVAHDEDLVRWDGATFTLDLDLSDEGLAPNLDLEAAHRRDDGTYLLSFSEGGSAGGVTFADEDILSLDPTDSTWTMFYDGSATHAGLVSASIDALYILVLGGDIFKDSFENSLTRGLN